MIKEMFDLSGKVAFISGSSRGIGFAIAEAFADAGATVVINGRKQESLLEAQSRLSDKGYSIHVMPFDVTDPQSVSAGIAKVENEIGPVDIAVNNAGIQRRAPFTEISEEIWRDVMETNLNAVFFVGREVAARMVPRKSGKIINICSLASEVGRPSIVPYTTAKGAVRMLTKGMCCELAGHNIQINGIGPGYFRTELNTDLYENREFNEWVCSRTPAGRWGELDELKGVAVFLASGASSFMNGQVIYVDGGLLSGM
ncbi:SDR family oxidoreductase [uncultured Martelella sp.]|uniref:SDR family oxidoreductase n=1 Tax=uncultured Martelella sp. TaxID=392331 RepID=UPI0029C88350|nr:SDR family oxidoreductase [uncultured Martelella sp.]